MTFISYAQNQEDVILWRALRDVEYGFYVDVGAADPEELSVTRAFYDRGWSGVNVEPLDQYFQRLVRDRPRDTNLKVAVGREAGVRTFHAIEGTGLSTLDAEIAARQQANGWQVHEIVVPVLTLTKILEDCGPRTIHFLKIDVEGAEGEVIEGLDLDRVRPWIIVIEATEPSSTVGTRYEWEHLVTVHGYCFAYFDGVNCFYVADEVASLKERLTVPPNVFDDFMRFPELVIRQEAGRLEQQIVDLRGNVGGLEAALQSERAQASNLRNALQVERAQASNLRNALQEEQAQASNLRNALQEEQAQNASLNARLDLLSGRVHKLEAHLAEPSLDRAIGRVFKRFHKAGDRITGGGLRSFTRRSLAMCIRSVSRQPLLKRLGRGALQPFPAISFRVREFAASIESSTFQSLPPTKLESGRKDYSALIHALYKTAFGRLPDEAALANWLDALRAGTPLERIARELAGSHEFLARHGSQQGVTAQLIATFYLDGLGRAPSEQELTSLLRAKQGASESNLLIAVGGLPEAIACVAGPHAPVRVSFLLGVSDDKEGLLRSLESIRVQTNPRWEAVLAVPPGMDEPFVSGLERLAAQDRRVLVNKSSGATTPSLADLLSRSTCDYVAVLTPGDELVKWAVADVAADVSNHPDTDVLYSDEGNLSDSGLPYLKPEWSPELLYAFNYFGRLCVLKRDLAIKVGGFDSSMGPAGEWDLNLRITDISASIRRIPKILCHRSAVGFRDRPSPEAPDAVFYRTAIKRFWSHRGVDARIETQSDGTQRSTWDISEPPLVSIIIPTKNKPVLLRSCMKSVMERTDYSRKEVIIVDNASDDPATLSLYRELEATPWITVRSHNKKFNYSAICNFGASLAKGDLLLFLNNDIEAISSDWLTELVRFAMRPGVGVVGTKLLYPSGTLQHAGVVLGIHMTGLVFRNAPLDEWGLFGSPNTPRNYLAVMGACQLVRKEVFARVGGFDECYLVANSDVALCLNAYRAGYRIAYNPFGALIHHEGASRGYENPSHDMQRSAGDIRRLGFASDPYFHPDLSGTNPIPTLRVEGDPSVHEIFEQDLVRYLRMTPSAVEWDLYNDHAIHNATGLSREMILWSSQRGDAIDDVWSAARYVIDLLRTRIDVRRRFPHALSDGAGGEFAKWITTDGGDHYLLTGSVRQRIATMFQNHISARARQAFWHNEDLKTEFPLAFTPVQQRGLFQWFMSYGRGEFDLRLEEIWWLLLECAEDPSLELIRTYWMTPEWQEACPEGPTVFGADALADWLATKFRLTASWIDPDDWSNAISPCQQIRVAYTANEEWRNMHPEAFTTLECARTFLTWLRGPTANLTDRAREWLSQIDLDSTEAKLIQPGVNIIGHFCYPSGLRTSVESIREALERAGVAVSLRDIKTDSKDDPHHSEYTGMELFDATIIHTQPTPFFETAFNRANLFERVPGTYRIGYWYWELNTVPQSWLRLLPMVDELWAATTFVSDALKLSFGSRVFTMFPGVQIGKFEARPRTYFQLSESEEFTFVYVFHLMSVMERKNPCGLIRAFRKAFSPMEPVRLVLKTTFGDRQPRSVQELQSLAAGANITIIDKIFSQDETLSLIDACDAYVSLHRSEGLGLTMAEAMLLGKPVIATRYSGNIDFMDETNSLLVDYELVQVGEANPPYDANALWAEPSIQHAASLMRRVYENRVWAAEFGARAKLNVQARMSLDVAGQRMAERLAQIDAERKHR